MKRRMVLGIVGGLGVLTACADFGFEDAAHHGLRIFCLASAAEVLPILNTPALQHAAVIVCQAAGYRMLITDPGVQPEPRPRG